jgi:hypothetical protein
MLPRRLSHNAALGCIVGALLSSGISSRRTGPCLPYGPATVELTGVLKVEDHFGPPNYGEDTTSDARLHVLMLHLTRPVVLCLDSLHTRTDSIAKIQLRVSPALRAEALIGRRVTASGYLEAQIWGSDFTEVVLWARSLQEAARLGQPS